MNTNIPIYPEIDDDDFYDLLLAKREFRQTKADASIYRGDINAENVMIRELEKQGVSEAESKYLADQVNRQAVMNKLCNPNMFTLQPPQEFIRNLISPNTPYNGILAFWGVGTGKTCMAIQAAEGLKDLVGKYGKKIYVLAKKQLQENFKKELYNFQKESLERKEKFPAGSSQCTGNTYWIPDAEEPNPAKRRRKIREKINEVYEFYAFQKFTNHVDTVIKAQYGNEGLKKYFSNSVLIIDEAHTLTGENKYREFNKKKRNQELEEESSEEETSDDEEEENIRRAYIKKTKKPSTTTTKPKLISDRGILAVLHDILTHASNIKIILLTATPMKDIGMELIDLINLLRLNDNKSLIKVTDIFTGTDSKGMENTFNKDELKKYTKGYISYVRGENPITFPRLIDINIKNHPYGDPVLYKPFPLFYEKGQRIPYPVVINIRDIGILSMNILQRLVTKWRMRKDIILML